ncbi:urease accessory protein UreD [Moritella sp. F3]|uniref:urease accessory protein UreD n=1 Tax=Moritella sp. F3 TaxID=2718882 RepID=UPI0018E0E6F8|nr:urease accessory protein UreD [Moritella sp. F3]GIC77766.1 urease accessory protein UreD [Moritella sp. F1]GIC83093.1 urease accessory protein UreD [Moritella sp. F3]
MNIPTRVSYSRPQNHQGWRAEIFLKYGVKRDKTRLLERQQLGPLMVQKTFFPEGNTCHTYLLHPPGGVVGGDQLSVSVALESGAHALLTTPGATKFYRSNGELAWQSQHLSAADGSFLEWLPMENIFFPGANCQLLTEVKLTGNARFIGWEMQCFGRPALGEDFIRGQLKGQARIFRDDKLLLVENLRLQDQLQLQQNASLNGYPMIGSLYISPADNILAAKINAVIDTQQIRFGDDVLLGATELEGLLVVRALGRQTEPMMASYVQVWSIVREHWLGVIPDVPRIWHT